MSTQFSKVYACYVWKQWEIWLQNYKMDTKTMHCMWILNINDAWKKILVNNIETKNFSVSMFLTKKFFMHHLCLGFTCIVLFLYPSCSFAVISLIVFTHNMHTLCYIGYSNWSKNWLINFWAVYFLVYTFFMCEL